MFRNLTSRLLNLTLTSTMKGKGGGKQRQSTKSKKRQEDPKPLQSHAKKPPTKNKLVAETLELKLSKKSQQKPSGNDKDFLSLVDTRAGYSDLVIKHSNAVGNSEIEQRHQSQSDGLPSTNFWAKSREKYRKISDKKKKPSVQSIEVEEPDRKRKKPTGSDMKVDDVIMISDANESSNEADCTIDLCHKTSQQKKNKKKSTKRETRQDSEEDVASSQEIDAGEDTPDEDVLPQSSEDIDESSSASRNELKGINVIEVQCGALLVMEPESDLCFHGNCRLTHLCGSVSVLGHKLKCSQSYALFSPNTNSLLTINCERVEEKSSVVKDIYKKFQVDWEKIGTADNVAILKLEYLDVSLNNTIQKYLPYRSIFSGDLDESKQKSPWKQTLKRIGMSVSNDDAPRVTVPDMYHTVADKAKKLLSTRKSEDSLPVITSVGGKNSGKSTMNRYLVNSLLNTVDKVYYLECDVGQTEFTPPGCVSLHCITEPVLGPPFTHQRHPVYSCFFGGVTPNDDPTRYLMCLEQCFNEYLTGCDNSKPLVVNTMGWNSGVGLALTVDTIRLVRPQLLVQIDTQKTAINFPPMSTDFVTQANGWSGKIWDETKWPHLFDDLRFTWLPVESVVNTAKSHIGKFRPFEHRDLAILGYFSNDLDTEVALTSKTPYTIPWNDVAIHVCHAEIDNSQILYAINGTLVGLCNADLSQAQRDDEELPYFFSSTPVCQCLGYGIVRAIDPVTRKLHIVTPLNLDDLQKVNTIMRGNINLPDQVLFAQECEGPVPYVINPISSTGSQVLRKRHMLPQKFKENDS